MKNYFIFLITLIILISGCNRPVGSNFVTEPANPYDWRLEFNGPIWTSPNLIDLNRDGNLDVLFIVGGPTMETVCDQARIFAVDSRNGVPLKGWNGKPVSSCYSAPASADLNGDGFNEVFLAGITLQGKTNYIYGWDWKGKPLPGWPINSTAMMEASPSIGRLKDSGLQVVVGDFNHFLHAYDVNGKELTGWPVELNHATHAPASIGDLNNDGKNEVVVLTDYSTLYVINADGSIAWKKQLIPDTILGIFAQPALADINNDGFLEVIVGDMGTCNDKRCDGKIYVWYWDGKPLNGWPFTSTSSFSSGPTIGDFNNDGKIDIVTTSINDHLSSTKEGYLYALNANGTLITKIKAPTYIENQPVLADVDGDNLIEAIFGCNDGYVYAFRFDGSVPDGWPKYIGHSVINTPAVGRDPSGKIMYVVAASEETWAGGAISVVKSWPISKQRYNKAPWPLFGHDAKHSGFYSQPLAFID